jgi:hypothetical protein
MGKGDPGGQHQARVGSIASLGLGECSAMSACKWNQSGILLVHGAER